MEGGREDQRVSKRVSLAVKPFSILVHRLSMLVKCAMTALC
jgi:hypothetical protein